MTNAVRMAVCVSVLAAGGAWAQDRGRTDGPEGSEVGKGGYTPASGGLGGFSLTLDGGGAFTTKGPQISPPLFAGITASYWNQEFYRIDLSGFYIPDPKIWGVMLGPSFHTTTWPVAFSAGFQAGLHIPNEGSVNFILSPRVGMDFITESHFQLGVNANWDLNLADFDRSIIRVYLSVGYRF
jgi:hypothetical protein